MGGWVCEVIYDKNYQQINSISIASSVVVSGTSNWTNKMFVLQLKYIQLTAFWCYYYTNIHHHLLANMPTHLLFYLRLQLFFGFCWESFLSKPLETRKRYNLEDRKYDNMFALFCKWSIVLPTQSTVTKVKTNAHVQYM